MGYVAVYVNPPGMGTVSQNRSGAQLTLTATPAAGQKFSHWKTIVVMPADWNAAHGRPNTPMVTERILSNPLSDSIDPRAISDEYYAYFVPTSTPPPIMHTVSVRVIGQGSIKIEPPGITTTSSSDTQIRQGYTVELYATPAPGWILKHWSTGETSSHISVFYDRSKDAILATFIQSPTTPPPPATDWKKLAMYGAGVLFGLGILGSAMKRRSRA